MRLRLLFLAILYFPGTVLHELSHFLAAKLLGVPTGRISLIPKANENGMEFGHVEIAKTDFVRRFLIGIAPFVSGTAVLATLVYINIYVHALPVWVYAAFAYIAVTVLNTMTLSKSDLQGSWKIAFILLLALVVLIVLH